MNDFPDARTGLRRVFVRGLTLEARLGVHAHEKARPQRVVIDVELAVVDADAPAGVGEDALPRVVDYAVVVELARHAATDGHTLLVETLAERIAVAALSDPRVQTARVAVAKPDAFADVLAVGVEVERRRVGERRSLSTALTDA